MLTKREYQQLARAFQTSAYTLINREPRVPLQAALMLLAEYVEPTPHVEVTVEPDGPMATTLGVRISWPEEGA